MTMPSDDVMRGMELCLSRYGRGWTSRSPLKDIGYTRGATICLSCMTIHRNIMTTQQVFVPKCLLCSKDSMEIPSLQVELDDIYPNETGRNPYVLYGILLMLGVLTNVKRDVVISPSGALLDYTSLCS